MMLSEKSLNYAQVFVDGDIVTEAKKHLAAANIEAILKTELGLLRCCMLLRMAKGRHEMSDEITLAQVEEFFKTLTGGDLPDGMTMPDQPRLTERQAFSVIWYLQEHLRIIPDNYEMCDVCLRLYDADCDGFYLDSDTEVDELSYTCSGLDISREVIKANAGQNFCSDDCEYSFFESILGKEAE